MVESDKETNKLKERSVVWNW